MASLDLNHITSISIIIIIMIFSKGSVAQQPYVGVTTTDCANDHNSSTGLGYFCNGLNTTCRTFITFRSTPPYHTVASISSLLGSDPAELSAANSVDLTTTFDANNLVLIPVSCSCSGQSYHSNTSYVIKDSDNYFGIANGTFQGLSTCQAISREAGNPEARELFVGQRITVPLRCACPTRNQTELGINYLVSYLVANGDFIFSIGERFGVSVGSMYEANSLSDTDNSIIGFTTLLIPLRNPPSSNQTTNRAPPPLPTTTTLSPPPQSSSKKKVWLYALVGAFGGVMVLVCVGAIVYCALFSAKKKKKEYSEVDPILATGKSFEPIKATKGLRDEEEGSQDFLEAIGEIAQSIKVYSFKELKKATNGFSPGNWIKGGVYRGMINGDSAAIKKVDGDISKEINLLQKINHFNVISLSGVGFNKGYWYLVYEYASKGPLSDWIFSTKVSTDDDKKFLSWTQRIQISLDIATGLNYLHSFANPSHVHKDIKSRNILLDDDLRAKIANFGLARSTTNGGDDGEFSLTKHIVGTIGYMAPEYLEHGLVSTKLDVYAFGVVLLEMVTGKEVAVLHEESANLSDVLSNEGKENNTFVDVSLGDQYPSELLGFVVKIIDNCMNKNPEARPTMDEIVQLLSITLSNSLASDLSQKS